MGNDNFSLMRGGAVHRFLSWTGALRPRLKLSRLIAALLVLVAVAPMLLAAWRSGTLTGDQVRIPLLGDYALLFRFLFALPLLILAAPLADHLLRAAIRQMSRGGFVRQDQQKRFQHILSTAKRWRDAWLPEAIALVIVLVPVTDSMRAPDLAQLSSWYGDGSATTSFAGFWFGHVAAPLFRFVGLLWLWRFLLWTWMLWKFSRLDLDLRPPHPDQNGGLAFLGLAQLRFSTMSIAGSLILCGSCINHFLYAGVTAGSLKLLLGSYVVGSAALLLAPLLLMAPPLIRAKRHALNKYSILGHRAIRHFDARWKRGEPPDHSSLIDSDNSSALADFSAVYTTVAGMSVIPINRRVLFTMLLSAALPLVPLVFFVMSLDELVAKLASILV